jgi:membrane fusion protein (multidrug efflux system)
MEQASSALESRTADLESAKANFEQSRSTYETTILSCRAQVESAGIAVRNAQLDLGYCRMTAPIDGRISRVNFDIGNLVGDGQSSVLATIVKMDPIYAYATISEGDVLKTPALTQFGASAHDRKVPVELGMASQEGFPISGVLDYSDPSLDASTGTLQTRGTFANTDRSLLPGMFVRMRIPVGKRTDAVLVPERSLGTDQSGQYVLVVNAEGQVEYRPVKIGMAVDDLRVVEGELAMTDQVIVEGLLRARPGAKVTPKPSAKQAAAAETAAVAEPE